MFNTASISEKPKSIWFTLVVWGASGLAGTITYLKTLPMKEVFTTASHLIGVLIVAIVTGYVGTIGKELASHHFKKWMEKRKSNPKIPKK